MQDVDGIEISDGVVHVDEGMMTGAEGIFAAGTWSPASARSPWRSVMAKRPPATSTAGCAVSRSSTPPAAAGDVDRLNTWYYTDAPKTVRPTLDSARRVSTFDEVKQGLDEQTAVYEARRCLSCGNCFGFDNCFGSAPTTRC